MTIFDSNSAAGCRDIRYLLGVYVVGAIEPAERAIVDDHLAVCQGCRDELAGLAALPAMLGRVPAADVERLSSGMLSDDPPPPGELLNSLLGRVSARRRSRLWRGAITVAAAAAVAAAGATAAVELAQPAAQPAQAVASATNSHTGVAAVVDYAKTPWGSTAMRVQVSGIPMGTRCQFWVLGANGSKSFAGTWTILASYGPHGWYSVGSHAAPSSVRGFQITSDGKVLLTIRAT